MMESKEESETLASDINHVHSIHHCCGGNYRGGMCDQIRNFRFHRPLVEPEEVTGGLYKR